MLWSDCIWALWAPRGVFLEEWAICEIIYLTGIKLVHYSSPEFLRIKSYHSTSFARGALSSLPDDPQGSVLCWGVFLGEPQAPPELSCSCSSWTNPLSKALNEVHETRWFLITPWCSAELVGKLLNGNDVIPIKGRCMCCWQDHAPHPRVSSDALVILYSLMLGGEFLEMSLHAA